MSKEYDHFWKYHNKTNMDIHAVELIELQEKRNAKLKEFIRTVIKVHCWGIEEIDGGDAQDKALELGLIEAHIATGTDPEFGDTIYRFSDMLKGDTDDSN